MTTSVVPECEAALVRLVRAAIRDDAEFHRTWPGPKATRRMGFLTETTWESYDDAAIKSGPRSRRERFDIGFEIWEFPLDDSVLDAGLVSDRAMGQLAVIESVLRDEDTARLGVDCVQHAVVRPERKEPFQFEKGYGFAIVGAVAVEAYLT